MPVYNGGAQLGPVVESVLSQTFGDFELLVLDDASTDGCVAPIDSYGDSRIRLVRNEHNLEQVPTLNRGLREARGEYVARLDQDDRCRPHRLKRQVEQLDREPQFALVGTWMDIVDEQGRLVWELRGRINDFQRERADRDDFGARDRVLPENAYGRACARHHVVQRPT